MPNRQHTYIYVGSKVSKIKRTSVDVLLLKFIRKFSSNDPFRLLLFLCSFGVETILIGFSYWRLSPKVLCMWSQNTVSCYDDYAVWSRSSFFLFEKSVSRKELSIDLRASIEGQYSSARLEPAFLTWWHGTGIELVYFELVSLSEQKYTAYEHFQETGSYGTKKKTDQVWTTKPLTHVFPWFLLHLNN